MAWIQALALLTLFALPGTHRPELRYRDDQWLDAAGSAVTSTGQVTERIRRPNYGTLLIDLSVDDPKAYTKPWTVTIKLEAVVDTELIEAVCEENEKDVQHFKAIPQHH